MSKENASTLEVYNKTASIYLETTKIHDNLDPEKAQKKKEKLEKFLKTNLEMAKATKVFEIGSADGVNAKFMQNLGYDVTASDIAEDFINAIKEKGLKTIKFNALEDEFPEEYSAIFCWRVFVHFTLEDAQKVLSKVYEALEDGGIFIFNAMNRETRTVDDEWVDFKNEYRMGVDRYYKYFKEEELNEIIGQIGFHISDFHKEGGENQKKWLVYVLKK